MAFDNLQFYRPMAVAAELRMTLEVSAVGSREHVALLRRLAEAIREGGRITVEVAGDSQPGTTWEIGPHDLLGPL